MKREGFEKSEVQNYRNGRRLMEAYLRSGKGFAELKAVIMSPALGKVRRFLVKGGKLPPEEHPLLQFWKLNIDFDLREILPKIEAPILGVWGSKDDGVPPRQALKTFNKKVKNSCSQGVLIQNADHGLYYRKETGPGWAPKEGRLLSRDYTKSIKTWLKKTLVNRACFKK